MHQLQPNKPQNIIQKQLASSMPTLLDKSLLTLEKMLDQGSFETRLQVATLIVKTAAALAKIKN